jgi:hypothetical protein
VMFVKCVAVRVPDKNSAVLTKHLGPANQSQVSLGGEVHALTPLAAASPAIHVFNGEKWLAAVR